MNKLPKHRALKLVLCNIVSIAFALPIFTSLFANDKPFALDFDSIFLAGKPNGQPSRPDTELVKSEFSILSGASQTFRVNKPEELPQTIGAGQRIAIFLPELSKNNLLVKVGIVVSPDSFKPGTENKQQSIAVRFNRKLIFKQLLKKNNNNISALVPASYLDKGINTLEIINPTLERMAFDYLAVEYYSLPVTDNKKQTPPLKADIAFNNSLGTKVAEYNEYGGNFGKKLPGIVTQRIVKHIKSNGKLFSLYQLAKNPGFFDPVTGKPVPAFKALKAITPLFEGNPEIVECNIIPIVQGATLRNTEWITVQNKSGVMTVLVSGRHESGTAVRLILPVTFKNKAKISITEGYKAEEQAKWKEAIIKDGTLSLDFSLNDSVVIRIQEEKAEVPKKLQLPSQIKPRIAIAKKHILKVLKKRPLSTFLRQTIRYSNGYRGVSGKAYSSKEVPATTGKIDNVRNVVPWGWKGKNELMEISFPEDGKNRGGGVSIYLGQGLANPDFLSFWVYPKSEKQVKTLSLLFTMKSRNETGVYSVSLKPDMWQRVQRSLVGEPPPYHGNLRFFVNPKQPEYKKSNKVSFEFDGICVLKKPDKSFRHRVIIAKKRGNTPESITMLFFGSPGTAVEYRHYFKKPVEFKKMNMLSKLPEKSKPALTYKKDAQILQVKFKFPKKTLPLSDKLKNLLTEKEEKLLKEKALMCAGIKIDF